MTTYTLEQRHARLAGMILENRVIRNQWTGVDAQGRETACLYASLVPENPMRPNECPANLMPVWLAELTPSIDDQGTGGQVWYRMVRRFALVLRRTHILAPEAWARLEIQKNVFDKKHRDDFALFQAKCETAKSILWVKYDHEFWDKDIIERQALLEGLYAARNVLMEEVNAVREPLWDVFTDALLSAVETECLKAEQLL